VGRSTGSAVTTPSAPHLARGDYVLQVGLVVIRGREASEQTAVGQMKQSPADVWLRTALRSIGPGRSR
jgi:hypothetical protein